MWNLILVILFTISSIYLFIKIGQILKKDKNILSVFNKNEADISKHSNSSPEIIIRFLKYLLIFIILGTIAFYFMINYINLNK